jgi:hypothetical protein
MKSVTPTPRQCSRTWTSEVDLEQHRYDHEPDQHGHRQIDLRHLRARDYAEEARHDVPERNARDDAEGNPECEVAFEDAHQATSGRRVVEPSLRQIFLSANMSFAGMARLFVGEHPGLGR